AQQIDILQVDFGVVLRRLRLESALGQAALQRHPAAFEAHLVVAARTRLLALVAATGRLAQARPDATTDATLGVLGARARLDGVEFHVLSSEGAYSTFTRYETLLIMPRTAGVSSSSRSLLSLRRPRPRTVARCDSLVPAMLLTSLTLTVFLSLMMLSSAEDLFDRQAALGSDLGRRAGVLQRVQGGANQVVRVGRAEALGHDVGHAHHFEHGAHRAAGDDAVTLLGRGHQHARRAVLANHALA